MHERQLHLFKGKRQKGVLPRSSEFELHCMVADALRRWCDPAWRYTHLPMGEKRDPATAMRLKRMGVTRGWPDFMFFGPRKQVLFLELKRPGPRRLREWQGTLSAMNKPSDEQEEMAQHLCGVCGHSYFCTNDFQSALDLLRDFGIVISRIGA